MTDVIDFLFKKSKVSENDIIIEAEKAFKLKVDNSSVEANEFGNWILEKMNILYQKSIGPVKQGEKESEERKIINERLENLSTKALSSSLQGMSKEDLIIWLKDYYAVKAYAENIDLANEWLK